MTENIDERFEPAVSEETVSTDTPFDAGTEPSEDLTEEAMAEEAAEEPGEVEIVGVKFRETGKTYYFSPGELRCTVGTPVIVETARGVEYGYVTIEHSVVSTANIVSPLRSVIRKADESDTARYQANKKLEADAFEICRKKIEDHGLDMKLIDAEYTFDNSKLLFYFSADIRVDFRELVKDLASVFKTRIELRQIGIRDEAKLMGGLGVCGMPLCCSTFLTDFVQVSIKMAKEQNLSLNSSKISGTCGRLMCCLRYEHESYEREIAATPPADSVVKTAEGVGVVIESSPLTGNLKVKLNDGDTKTFHRDTVTVLSRHSKKAPEQQDQESEEDWE